MKGGLWLTSYVMLWLAVLVLAGAVVALLRQVGVLHARLHPLGVHFAGEGPELESRAPRVDGVSYEGGLTLLAFTSPTCEVCALLKPSFEAIRRDYDDVRLHLLDLADSPSTFDAFKVRSTPYLVVVDGGGVVRGRGVANSLEQIEELLVEAQA